MDDSIRGSSGVDKKQIRLKINSMVFPIIIENILQLAAGIISMGMVGRLGTTSVAAQGICALLTGIIWNIFKGISVGTMVMVANAYGCKDGQRIRVVAQHGLLSLILLGAVLQLITHRYSEPLLLLFNPHIDVLNDAMIYFRIIIYGLPFVAIMLCVTGILQGMGNAKTPMILALIMNIINIILGYILIFGKLGMKSMGLSGAALALVISQGAGAFAGLWVLFKAKNIVYSRSKPMVFRLDLGTINDIFKIGIPLGMEAAFWQLSSIIISRIILSFGEAPFAAYQFGIQAEAIAEMPALGFGVAATAFTGQTLGAMDIDLGKRYLWEIGREALIVISIGAMVLLLFPHPIMELFTEEPEVIELGIIYIRLVALVQLPQNLQRVFSGALVGAGFTRIPMLIAGIGIWGFRIPLCLIISRYLTSGIIAIWIVICMDQVLRFVLSYVLFKRKNIFAESS